MNPVSRVERFHCPDGEILIADVAGDPAQPTVILMHGGGQTRHSWRTAMDALAAEGFHVINFDARGHGESSWAKDGIYSFETRARDLEVVVRHAGSRVALVGASMGGGTAMHAINNGMKADALVLVDIVSMPAAGGIARILAFMQRNLDGFGSLEDAADAIAAYKAHQSRPKNLDGLAKNLRRNEAGRYFWHWDPAILRDPSGDNAALMRMFDGQHWDVPTLLVRGLQSDVVDDDGIHDLRRKIPALELFDVPEAGHMVAGDNNDVFNRGVIDFLKRKMPLDAARHSADG